MVQINNSLALVQIMVWCRPGDKPLSEPMIVILLTRICVTRPRWVNAFGFHSFRLIWFCFIKYRCGLLWVKGRYGDISVLCSILTALATWFWWLETHVFLIISTVATAGMVLKHQVISINIYGKIVIALNYVHTMYYICYEKTWDNNIPFRNKLFKEYGSMATIFFILTITLYSYQHEPTKHHSKKH